MQELITQGMQQKIIKVLLSVDETEKNTTMVGPIVSNEWNVFFFSDYK